MSKKSQTSLFIIVAVLLFIMIAVYLGLSYSKPESKENAVNQLDTTSVVEFANQCLHDVAQDGIIKNAMQGGYYKLPSSYLLTPFGSVPFYYHDDSRTDPGKDVLENELRLYLIEHLNYCIRKFRHFREMGYKVTTGKYDPKVVINDDNVDISMKYPVRISKNDLVSEVNDFRTVVDIPYGKMYKVAELITDDVEKDPYFIHTSSNFGYMSKYGVQIDTISFGLSTVYVLVDKNVKLPNDLKLMYLFTVKPSSKNHKPELFVDDYLEAKVGEEFTYWVYAKDIEGDKIEYSDDTDLFDIGKYSGLIEFTPTEDQIGSYFVKITADDGVDKVTKEVNVRVVG